MCVTGFHRYRCQRCGGISLLVDAEGLEIPHQKPCDWVHRYSASFGTCNESKSSIQIHQKDWQGAQFYCIRCTVGGDGSNDANKTEKGRDEFEQSQG